MGLEIRRTAMSLCLSFLTDTWFIIGQSRRRLYEAFPAKLPSPPVNHLWHCQESNELMEIRYQQVT